MSAITVENDGKKHEVSYPRRIIVSANVPEGGCARAVRGYRKNASRTSAQPWRRASERRRSGADAGERRTPP